MAGREEIREMIRTRFADAYGGGHLGEYFNSEDATKELMQRLHSQGVVLKVDKPLPTRFLVITRSLQEAYEQAERDMLKAGYVATESLIEERE